jgi:hypothetical protein
MNMESTGFETITHGINREIEKTLQLPLLTSSTERSFTPPDSSRVGGVKRVVLGGNRTINYFLIIVFLLFISSLVMGFSMGPGVIHDAPRSTSNKTNCEMLMFEGGVLNVIWKTIFWKRHDSGGVSVGSEVKPSEPVTSLTQSVRIGVVSGSGTVEREI